MAAIGSASRLGPAEATGDYLTKQAVLLDRLALSCEGGVGLRGDGASAVGGAPPITSSVPRPRVQLMLAAHAINEVEIVEGDSSQNGVSTPLSTQKLHLSHSTSVTLSTMAAPEPAAAAVNGTHKYSTL